MRYHLVSGFGALVVVVGTTRAEDKPRLPVGPSPIQVIAQMGDKTSVTLVIPYTEVTAEEFKDGTVRITQAPREETRTVPLKEVKVYGTDRKEVDEGLLSRLLRQRVPALCSTDGKQVDPLHLRLVKEGTLIFVGPVPKGLAVKSVPEVVVPARMPPPAPLPSGARP